MDPMAPSENRNKIPGAEPKEVVVHHKKTDPAELAVKENVRRVSKIFFLKNKQKEISKEIDALCSKMEPVLESEQRRRRTLFADSEVRPEAVRLHQGMKEETVVRKKQEKEVMDSFEVNENKAKLHQFLVKQKERMDKAHKFVEIGFGVVDSLVATGQTLEDFESVSGNDAVKAAWDNFSTSHTEETGVALIDDVVRGEFEYWIDLAIQCAAVDLETQKLEQLGAKIEDKKSEVKKAKRAKDENYGTLKNELTALQELHKAQEHKVEKLRNKRGFGILEAVVEKSAAYAGALNDLFTKGAVACNTLEGLVDGVAGAGALVTLVKTIEKLAKEIDRVDDIKQKIEQLTVFHKEFLEADNPCGIYAAGLVSNMLSLKTLHLKRSAEIAKSEIAFAALNALSATVSAGKLGVALGAVLSSTVLATPGLNAAAAVIAVVTSGGIKTKKLYDMLKHDREGLKLDVQIREKTAQVYTSAGRFYAESMRFGSVQKELEEVMYKDADLRSAIQTFRDSRVESPVEEADVAKSVSLIGIEDFYDSVESGLQLELAPVSVRKLELVESYDLIQEKLYKMSLVLDQMILRKGALEDDRSLETLSHEFTQVKKSDILVQYNLFESSLEDPQTRAELVSWLTEEEVPITGDYVFESILRFIRNDKALPKSALPVTVNIHAAPSLLSPSPSHRRG